MCQMLGHHIEQVQDDQSEWHTQLACTEVHARNMMVGGVFDIPDEELQNLAGPVDHRIEMIQELGDVPHISLERPGERALGMEYVAHRQCD